MPLSLNTSGLRLMKALRPQELAGKLCRKLCALYLPLSQRASPKNMWWTLSSIKCVRGRPVLSWGCATQLAAHAFPSCPVSPCVVHAFEPRADTVSLRQRYIAGKKEKKWKNTTPDVKHANFTAISGTLRKQSVNSGRQAGRQKLGKSVGILLRGVDSLEEALAQTCTVCGRGATWLALEELVSHFGFSLFWLCDLEWLT